VSVASCPECGRELAGPIVCSACAVRIERRAVAAIVAWLRRLDSDDALYDRVVPPNESDGSLRYAAIAIERGEWKEQR
jgi:hypothetical protein